VHNVPMYPNFEALTTILSAELHAGGGSSHTEEHIQYISGLLGAMRFNPDEWLQYSKFINNRYTRNLVGYHDKFTVLILCWEKGQESPVHDHAGSSCWVKVLEGSLTETRYRTPTEAEAAAGAPITVESESVFAAEGVAYINDSMGLHKMGNQSLKERCVTLHVYSPPYKSCNCYDVLTGKTRHVPVTAESGVYHKFMDPTLAAANAAATTDLQRLVGTLEDTFRTAELNAQKCASSAGAAAAAGAIVTPPPTTEIQAILDNFNFRPEEWRKYVHFSEHRYIRALLGSTDRFSLFLNCWNRDQATPPHTHGSGEDDPRVWIKVLEGVVAMTRYPGGNPCDEDDARVRLLNSSTPATCFDHNIGVHKASNPSSEHTAVSLHVYSPPYMHCVSLCKKVQVPISYCNPEQQTRHHSHGNSSSSSSSNSNGGSPGGSARANVDHDNDNDKDRHAGGENAEDDADADDGNVDDNSTDDARADPNHGVCRGIAADRIGSACASGLVFETVASFTELVREELSVRDPKAPGGVRARTEAEVDSAHMCRLLEGISLPPSEVDTYAPGEDVAAGGGFKRTLISFGRGFSMYIMCFGPGHAGEAHTHNGSRGWLKVLRGRIHETRYAEDAETKEVYEDSASVLGEGKVIEMQPDIIHRLRNPFKGQVAYTLQIYSPPLAEAVFFDALNVSRENAVEVE
jgi:cysteine dioxygenase